MSSSKFPCNKYDLSVAQTCTSPIDVALNHLSLKEYHGLRKSEVVFIGGSQSMFDDACALHFEKEEGGWRTTHGNKLMFCTASQFRGKHPSVVFLINPSAEDMKLIEVLPGEIKVTVVMDKRTIHERLTGTFL